MSSHNFVLIKYLFRYYVRFEVFTAVTKKDVAFLDVKPCGSFTRLIRRNIADDDILHSHRRENLKSYIALTGPVRTSQETVRLHYKVQPVNAM
jgi:hypothetical protein